MKRVALLVDARSLGCAVQRQTNREMRVDYGALARLAQTGMQQTIAKKMAWQDERSLIRVNAYLGPSRNGRQDSFINELREVGFIVKVCNNQFTEQPKSNTDLVMLADALALIYTNKIDVLVLATADSDFYLATQAAKLLGVQVELISVQGQAIPEFADMADVFVDCGRAGLLMAQKGKTHEKNNRTRTCLQTAQQMTHP